MTARLPLACPVTVLPNSDPGRTTSARRAAIAAATTVQRQLRALVITAPEKVRARFRGQSTREMLTTAPPGCVRAPPVATCTPSPR